MTRKRFIKLCMGDGTSRNAARELAAELQPGVSYELFFEVFYTWKRVMKAVDKMSEEIANATITVEEARRAFCELSAIGVSAEDVGLEGLIDGT